MARTKKAREDIEVCCERNLTNSILKNGMTHLIELSREIRMKPSWVDTTSWGYGRYSCSYKGKRVVYYYVDKDKIYVTLTLTEPGMKNELQECYSALPNDYKREIAVTKIRHCDWHGNAGCSHCGNSVNISYDGIEYSHCTRFNFTLNLITPEHFEMVEYFIKLRRTIIDNSV